MVFVDVSKDNGIWKVANGMRVRLEPARGGGEYDREANGGIIARITNLGDGPVPEFNLAPYGKSYLFVRDSGAVQKAAFLSPTGYGQPRWLTCARSINTSSGGSGGTSTYSARLSVQSDTTRITGHLDWNSQGKLNVVSPIVI